MILNMKKLKKLLEQRKIQEMINAENNLKSEFRVVERGNALWLTFRGVAFKKIDGDICAEHVAVLLSEARTTAINFERL